MPEARIDKWMWAVRIFKTRTIAAEACKKGRISINGSYVKAARMIKPGDVIRYRNDAGDAYKELGSAVQKIVPKEFMPKAMQKVGEALNWVVFNSHEKMLRNKQGDESKQRELWQLEKKVADLINEGFITNFDNLISYLRKQYSKRNYPAVFQLQQENTNFIHYK